MGPYMNLLTKPQTKTSCHYRLQQNLQWFITIEKTCLLIHNSIEIHSYTREAPLLLRSNYSYGSWTLCNGPLFFIKNTYHQKVKLKECATLTSYPTYPYISQNHPIYEICVCFKLTHWFQHRDLTWLLQFWGVIWWKKRKKTEKPIMLEKESKMPFFLTMSEITVV